MMDSKQQWWASLPDECPITLEPLCALPYPPFALSDGGDTGSRHADYFDGLALATYVVSQGTFANPLTRHPLAYEDCVRLDAYLQEHIYSSKRTGQVQDQFAVLGGETISVKEAFLLRQSIKVKVDGGSNQSESDRRRAEALRNQAAVALRGLFVFGLRTEGRASNDDGWEAVQEASNGQALARAPGGFNLHYNPDANASTSQQEGLRIVDDDEAAFEAADVAVWQEVQQAFPHLVPDQPPLAHTANEDNGPSEILETVRQTARLTMNEEREEHARLQRQRQLYFMHALERKRNRLDARRKAKEEAAGVFLREKEAKDELQSARDEIDRWRTQQWEEWERVATVHVSEAEAADARSASITSPLETNDDATKVAQKSASQNKEQTVEEKAAKAAAKKKAKRQKAKERAKEKKRLEKLEQEKKELALARQKEKENSDVKCGACGEGILGCGFEKFGMLFCSTKCARAGPS